MTSDGIPLLKKQRVTKDNIVKDLAIFENKDFGSVRVVERDGEPWFVARDVAKALGYSEASNPARLFANIPEEWKGIQRMNTLGGEQEMLTISEQGLYFFLGRSDKPAALPYQKWVAGEVIPSIRKTGSYSVTAQGIAPVSKDFQAVFTAMSLFMDKNQAALCANTAVKNLHNTDLLALAGATHLPTQDDRQFYTPTELGKESGVSAVAFNKLLESNGLQEKHSDKWEATEKGKEFCKMFDTGKKHGGSNILQMKWSRDVLQMIGL
jgi:prophage antirepressor-like protein